MGRRLVPSSLAVARKNFVEGVDPLTILLPWEQRAAEIYLRVGMVAELTNRKGEPYGDSFHEALFQDLQFLPKNTWYLKRLQANPAFRAYVKYLKEHARDAALDTLHAKAGRAVDNYLWAQEAARKAEDYKETRMASADHLDRIGATEKPPTTTVQVANIQLHSRNFTADDLLAPSPQLEGEVVEPEETKE